MKILRTVIDHEGDRVEATGEISYTHPVTGATVTESLTVTLQESLALPQAGWTNEDEAAAVDAALKARDILVPVEVAAAKIAAVLVVEEVPIP